MALKVKTYNNVQANVTFSKASSRVEINPTAGEAATENIALTLGKISKWYDSLVPTGGSSGKFLGWNSSGTAKWVDAPTAEDKNMSQTLKTDNVNRPLLMSIESTSNTTATVTTTGARNNSMYGNVSTGLIFCRGREISNVTLKTGSTAQSHITLNTLMTWLITSKQYIPSGKYCHVVLTTAWDYSNSDILQVSINGTNYEIQLAGVIIEFLGSATSYNAGTFRLLIHSSPTTSFTAATGYTKFPTATIAEYTCNGSSYSPIWKMILNAHPTITVSADTTSATPLSHGGTFTAITSVTRDSNGHTTKVNTATYTLPAQYSHPTYTERTKDIYKFHVNTTGHVDDASTLDANDVSGLLNKLTTGSSTPTDADYYISQYVGGGTTTTSYHRRPMSALWSYINGKISATTSGSGNAVTSVSYANGVITATKGSTFLASTTKYAGSSSVGGPANLLAYSHTNEINFSGGKQAICYFNYRDADTNAEDTGETPVSINYKFCDYRNSTAYTTITAANFAGNASTATKWKTARTLTIGSTGKSVDGSGNVSWSLSEIGAAPASHTHDSLEMKTLTASTIDTTAGTYGFKGTGLLGNTSADWAGFQVDASNDRFQLTANGQLLFRQNDESTMAGNWSAWVGCITPNNVSATSGIKVTKTTSSVGTGDGSLTYYSGVKIEHDVSTSADTTNTGTLSHGGTFTAITSVTRDSYGHVKTLNTKTYTLPGSGDTDTKVTQTAVGSTYTNYRPLVISASNADSTPPTATTVTDGTFITSSIYCQPSSGSVYATKFVGPLDVSRVTKDSKAFPGANKAIIEEYAAGSTYNLPSNHYYHIISIQGPDTKFGTQLALGMTTTGAYYRNYNNQTWSDWKNIINSNTTYGISGAYGDSNNNTWKTTLTAGGSGTSSTVPTSSTSAYGITKLYNGVDSTSTGLAATANAVKTAYDKANHSHPYLPFETVTTDLSANTYFTKTAWVNWNKNAGTSTTNLPTTNWGILLTKALPSVQVWIPDNATGMYFRRKADANTNPTAWWGFTGTAGNTYDLSNMSNTGLGSRALTSRTALDTTSGSFIFSVSPIAAGDTYDWVGFQADAGNDRFQLIPYGSVLLYRENDDTTPTSAGWTNFYALRSLDGVSGSNGITVDYNTGSIGTGDDKITYTTSIVVKHTNSITAGTAKGDNSKTLTFGGTFKIPSITYDANGHITTWTTTTMTMPSNPNTNTTYTLGTSTDTTVTPNEDTVTLTPSSGSVQTIKVPYAKRAKYVYTDSIGSGAASHAAALQTYFNANKDSINRNSVLGYYSNAESNGSICMGYFLNGYNDTPYGGFFVAHYNTPKYVGISNGTFTQHILLSSQNYTDYTVKKDGTGASGSWDINASTATRSSYIDIVASNEVRFSVATKPANATDIHIGHAWSDGTSDAKINTYIFKNGGGALALIKSKGYYLVDSGGNTYTGLYDNGLNLWIGSTQTQAKHHIGQTFISAGYNSTNSTGNSTIYISVPTDANNNGTNYAALHAGNFTTTGSGNAITSVAFTDEKLTFTKGSTFSLSTHTHNYAGSASAGGPATSVATAEANADANRVVFFADNTDTKKLVYDNDFKYNPSTNELTAQKFKGSLLRYHPSADLSKADIDTTVSVTEYPSYTFSYVQTPAIFGGTDGRMGDSSGNWWAHYAVMSHGSGNSQYRYILRFPFWGAPQYQRPAATSSNERWRNILTDETGAGGSYFLAYPADGYYYSHGGATGAIDITLPVGPGMMLSFSVDIWDYAANKSCTYKIAGYGYASDNKWYGTTAYCIGKPTHSMAIPIASSGGQTEITNLNVRFGYNNTSKKLKVQIGETDTSWSYLAVQIHDVTFCYGTTYFSTISKGWSIGLVTSNIPNVSSTIKATNIAYHASAIALTHGNECNFTGPSSGNTNIWFGYRKADVDGTETNTAYISRYLFGNGNNTAVAGITCGDIIINTATTGTPTLSFIRGTTSDNYYDWRLRDSGGDFYFDVCTGSNTWTSRAWFPYGSNNFTILGSMSLKNGSYTATVQPSTMTANRTLVLPDKSGGLPVSNILYENSTGTQAPVVAEAKGYKYFIVTVYHGTLGEQTAMITPNQSFTDHCYFSWTRIDDSQAASLRVAGAHIKVEPASSTNSITFTVYISDRHILAPGNSSTISSVATSGTPVIRKIIGFM